MKAGSVLAECGLVSELPLQPSESRNVLPLWTIFPSAIIVQNALCSLYSISIFLIHIHFYFNPSPSTLLPIRLYECSCFVYNKSLLVGSMKLFGIILG